MRFLNSIQRHAAILIIYTFKFDLFLKCFFFFFCHSPSSRLQPIVGQATGRSLEVRGHRTLWGRLLLLSLPYPPPPPAGLPLPWRTERGGGRRGEHRLSLKIITKKGSMQAAWHKTGPTMIYICCFLCVCVCTCCTHRNVMVTHWIKNWM